MRNPLTSFLSALTILVILSPSVLAVPVSYIGTVDYVGDWTAGHVFKAVSATGTTEKTMYSAVLLLNHMASAGEEVVFYFDGIRVRNVTQPLPGTVEDLQTIIVPGTPSITSKTPADDNVYITELQQQAFSVVASDSRGADVTYEWYKDGALVSKASMYTFVGNNTNKGSNAGNYTIQVRAYNNIVYSDNATWKLNVDRVKDVDGDGFPDSIDLCPFTHDTINNGASCVDDKDGDGNLDATDTVIGNETFMTTNIDNIALKIGDFASISDTITGDQQVKFSVGATDVVTFDFDFDVGTIDLSTVTIKKEENAATTGSIIVQGLDLGAQGKTKTVTVSKLSSGSNAVCIKDAEILSVSEITSGCSGADEHLVKCDGVTRDGYTCVYESVGSKYKVSGLKHSGVMESYQAPVSSTSSSSTPASSGGGGGGGIAPSVSARTITPLTSITQSATSVSRYAVDIENTGSADATFRLEISGLPSGYYTVSDSVTVPVIGGNKRGTLYYTLTLPADATDKTFTVSVKGTAGLLSSTTSYSVSLKVLSAATGAATTTTTMPSTGITLPSLPGIVIPTAAITGAVTSLSGNIYAQAATGVVAAAVIAVLAIRTFARRRTPWRTDYYKPKVQADVLDGMKKQVKRRFADEDWVRKL